MYLFSMDEVSSEEGAPESGELVAKVDGILFSNKGTDYYVLRVLEGKRRLTVRGTFPGVPLSVGMKVQFRGTWENHPKYGKQLSAATAQVLIEKGRNGVVTYIINNVKSVGPVTAGKLYNVFGDDLIQVLEKTPDRLRECDFLNQRQVQAITEEWKKSSEQRTISIILTDLGLGPSQVRSVYTRFGSKTKKVLKENPYSLYECPGVGFPTADQVARKLGVGRDDPRRMEAIILYAMEDLCFSEGHMYVQSDDVKPRIQRMFRRGLESFSYGDYMEDSSYYSSLRRLRDAGKVVSDGFKLYLRRQWEDESGAAAYVADVLRKGPRDFSDLRKFVSDFERDRGISLSDLQREAVMMLGKSRICAVSGYPGTGKTTLVTALVSLFERENLHYVLLSPTGIAAKRLSQVTGKPAATIHRALGYKSDGGWEFHELNKFHVDAVIVDETSMVDSSVFHSLMKALPDTAVIVFVGDDAQLPSVGAGSVLTSLLRCSDVPHVALTRIFRQAAESDIVTVSHRILKGEAVDTSFQRDSQFLFLHLRRNVVVDEICRLTHRMKERGVNFQVIAPKYDGELGVNTLNKRLRHVLNPSFVAGNASKIKHGSCDMYEGDRVMIVKNDYDRQVFNGDVGKVQRISLKDDTVEVRVFNWFDQESTVPRYVDKVFTFKIDECRNMLSVAYACTAHKVQGQEFDYVIMPMTMQFGIMLYRNLIYTALTRAKKKVFLFGDPDAFAFAATNERETSRNSDLSLLISEGLRDSSPAMVGT